MHSLVVKIRKMDDVKKWFYGLMILGLFASLISILVTHGESLKSVLIHDVNNTFMDFFNSVYNCRNGNPYETMSNYPPLANLFYYFIGMMIPRENMTESGFVIRASQIGILIHTLYLTAIVSFLVLLINRFKRGLRFEKHLFLFIILFSTPFVFTFERSNILIIALLFSMIFVFCKDSKKEAIREIAYVSLAIAAAIKIYPALFGLLLVQEKRYKDAIKTVIYGIAFFFLPFAFFNGVPDILLFIKGITLSTNLAQEGLGFGYQLGVGNTIQLIGAFFNNYQPSLVQIGSYISFFALAIGVISSFFIDGGWKRTALLCLLMLLCSNFVFVYVLVFILIPLIMFLDCKETRKPKDYVYMCLFALVLMPITYGGRDFFSSFIQTSWPLSISTVVQRFSLIVMLIMLIAESTIAFVKQFNTNKLLSIAVAASTAVLLISTLLSCIVATLNI